MSENHTGRYPPPNPWGASPQHGPHGGQHGVTTPIVIRTFAYIRAAATKGLAVGALVLIAGELTMPPTLKPSYLIGTFHGSIEAAEIKAKQPATVALNNELATTQANAQARAQIEVNNAQVQQQMTASALELQATLANVADAVCIGGGIWALLNGQDDRYSSAAKQTCGAGDALRDSINDDLRRANRDYSGIVNRPQNIRAPEPPRPAPATRPVRAHTETVTRPYVTRSGQTVSFMDVSQQLNDVYDESPIPETAARRR